MPRWPVRPARARDLTTPFGDDVIAASRGIVLVPETGIAVHDVVLTRGISGKADNPQPPALHERDAARDFTKCDVTAGIVPLASQIETDIVEVDVAQTTVGRIDPKRSIDIHSTALATRGRESKSHLIGTGSVAVRK